MFKHSDFLIFIREKVANILLLLLLEKEQKITIAFLSKKSDLNYSHTKKVIQKYEECGFITTKKIGRDRIIALTTKGKKVAQLLLKIKNESNELVNVK